MKNNKFCHSVRLSLAHAMHAFSVADSGDVVTQYARRNGAAIGSHIRAFSSIGSALKLDLTSIKKPS